MKQSTNETTLYSLTFLLPAMLLAGCAPAVRLRSLPVPGSVESTREEAWPRLEDLPIHSFWPDEWAEVAQKTREYYLCDVSIPEPFIDQSLLSRSRSALARARAGIRRTRASTPIGVVAPSYRAEKISTIDIDCNETEIRFAINRQNLAVDQLFVRISTSPLPASNASNGASTRVAFLGVSYRHKRLVYLTISETGEFFTIADVRRYLTGTAYQTVVDLPAYLGVRGMIYFIPREAHDGLVFAAPVEHREGTAFGMAKVHLEH
jgi:hypothetical protein